MDTIDTIVSEAAVQSRRRSAAWLAHEVFRAIYAWSEKRRSRGELRMLTDDQLRDIGLTRREVHREVAKSFFWD